MLSKNKTKLIQSLSTKKYRQKYNKFVVEGHKTCIEFIRSKKYKITELIAYDEWLRDYQNLLDINSINGTPISSSLMKSLSCFTTPSPVLLVCEMGKAEPQNLEDLNKIIYLDSIQDPGNFGTIIRIADWFGIDAIITSPGTVDKFNPKVISASMGSFVNIIICEDNGLMVEKLSLTHAIIGADLVGVDFKKFNYPKRSILCFGNEGHGLTTQLKQKIDISVTIPGSNKKVAESLNVGMAVAILCSNW